ncbi:GntR family transcriptional regulator [Caproiciproducens sp.]
MAANNDMIPIYYQLKEILISKIRDGEYALGDKVPSETELCNTFQVSRITAKRTLDEMVHEGYIERIPGRGSFVCHTHIEHALSQFYSFTEEVKRLNMTPSAHILNLERIKPGKELNKLLNLNGENVIYIRRQRLANNRVIALDHSFIPEKFYGEIDKEDLLENSLYKILERNGCRPDRAVESFMAASLSREEAELLSMKEGEAALKVTRHAFHGKETVEYNYRYYKNDCYTYSIELK